MEKSLRMAAPTDTTTNFTPWQTQAGQESPDALELLRQQYIALKTQAQPRLQRVYRMITRTKG